MSIRKITLKKTAQRTALIARDSWGRGRTRAEVAACVATSDWKGSVTQKCKLGSGHSSQTRLTAVLAPHLPIARNRRRGLHERRLSRSASCDLLQLQTTASRPSGPLPEDDEHRPSCRAPKTNVDGRGCVETLADGPSARVCARRRGLELARECDDAVSLGQLRIAAISPRIPISEIIRLML